MPCDDIKFQYMLNTESVVFDVGGFHGDFTAWIREQYGCPVHCWEPVFVRELKERFKEDPLVWIYDSALDAYDGEVEIHVNNDSTSLYHETEGSVKKLVKVRDIIKFIEHQALPQIDLLKLNCEGSEYHILRALRNNGYIKNVRNIVVQYHPIGNQGVTLGATHECRVKTDHWQWHVAKDTNGPTAS